MARKDSDVTARVFAYLEQQNRPYSTNDIFLNLHKEIGKTAIQKSLDLLIQDSLIKEKAYGKQKVYVVNQDKFPPLNEAELKGMDDKINMLTHELKERSKEINEEEIKLKLLVNSRTTDEAQKITQMELENVLQLQTKLSSLKNSQVVISQQEKQQRQQRYSKMAQEWKLRKRMTMEILDAILEGYPKSKKELFEEIGIETDEDVGVTMP